MASLSTTKRNGKTCYQIWIGVEPNRSNIWLGKISKSEANEIFSHIATLSSSKENCTGLRGSTVDWLNSIEDRLYDKLVKSELVEARCAIHVKEFFEERLAALRCSDRTRDIYQRAHQKFFEFLGGERRLLRKVTPKEASDFYNVFLPQKIKAESYRGKTARIIREFFGRAVKLKLIDSNPFDGFQIAEHIERSRHVYIDRPDIHKLINVAIDTRWRCMLGFAALCGLRTRSEIAAMRWEFINWDENTFTVPHCKTSVRTVPIFGDFRPYLDQYQEVCISREPMRVLKGPVFPNCPSQTQLTNRLSRTATKAGMQPWPKPWINLRSSVETWLVRQGFDLTTVSSWLGNSPIIAQKHYLQITPGDIAAAADLKKFSNSFQNTAEPPSIGTMPKIKAPINQGFEASQYTPLDSNQ